MLYNARLDEEAATRPVTPLTAELVAARTQRAHLTPPPGWTGGILHRLNLANRLRRSPLNADWLGEGEQTAAASVRSELRLLRLVAAFKRHFQTVDARQKVGAPRDRNARGVTSLKIHK